MRSYKFFIVGLRCSCVRLVSVHNLCIRTYSDITSLVHTFPFIVMNIRLGEMQSQYQTTGWYWTGIAALIPQTYLVFLSWGIFRNRYYELFKKYVFSGF